MGATMYGLLELYVPQAENEKEAATEFSSTEIEADERDDEGEGEQETQTVVATSLQEQR
jgi:hypothetical protein